LISLYASALSVSRNTPAVVLVVCVGCFSEGKEDELLGRLEKKIGKSKDEVRQMIAQMQPLMEVEKGEL
jgi:hypothetical protein